MDFEKEESTKRRFLTRFIEEQYRKINKSLSLRIVKNYFKLMIITGILMFLVFVPVYLLAEFSSYNKYCDSVIVALESGMENSSVINPYKEQGVEAVITDNSTGSVFYSDYDRNGKPFMGVFKSFLFNDSDEEFYFLVVNREMIRINEKEYDADFYCDLTEEYRNMWTIIRYLIAAYIIILVFILNEAKRSNAHILKPIDNVSDQISRLSVGNLSSLRLNVEGTSDELQNLAVVFNKMLDRIDASYENQKLFVSNASHELRTPIAVVLGYANMLKRWGSRDEEVLTESVDSIKNEAENMQELVNKLLILSRADKKTFKLERSYFDMADMVEELVKETEMVVAERVIECPALEHVEVFGDKQSLKQAIRVFIENAVKYSESGDSIRIYCRNLGGDAVVTVEDTGLGMQQKDMDNIFERFYRSDNVRDKKIGGHGLGLAIAKMIITSHAGRIRVRSQYTVGTSFIVTIPRERMHRTESA